MNDQDAARIIRLLEEIRDGQRLQLERQAQALERQAQALERQAELLSQQRDRLMGLSKIHGEAANIEADAKAVLAKSAKLVAGARLLTFIALPLAVLVLAFILWVLFARL